MIVNRRFQSIGAELEHESAFEYGWCEKRRPSRGFALVGLAILLSSIRCPAYHNIYILKPLAFRATAHGEAKTAAPRWRIPS